MCSAPLHWMRTEWVTTGMPFMTALNKWLKRGDSGPHFWAMCEHMAQKCGPESPRFSHLFNAVIKGIPVVTHSVLIQCSGAEHIATIPPLRTHRVRKDLQHKVSGTNNVAARRLSIRS